MAPEDWDALMQGEENFGRQRGPDGGIKRLDRAAHELAESGFEYFIDVETHGVRSTYNAGCRCDPCRRAEREYRRALRHRP